MKIFTRKDVGDCIDNYDYVIRFGNFALNLLFSGRITADVAWRPRAYIDHRCIIETEGR